ncbi:hypothetical protein CDAR_388861 [Caerostris darwini]|uniref:Uncharacterized protein n=1 Tax=Caerostris darwini TaxID=1538125 RepID=A0AAV4S704_9ARAC|nr:hypothetical protein CDAR_388861 [Caerostris darwini]
MSQYWETHSLPVHRSAATHCPARVLSLCPPAEDKGQRWEGVWNITQFKRSDTDISHNISRRYPPKSSSSNLTKQTDTDKESLRTIFKAARQILPQSQRQREESAGNKTHPLRLNYWRASFRGSQSPLESSRVCDGSNTSPPCHPWRNVIGGPDHRATLEK